VHDKKLARTITCHTRRLWLIPFGYMDLVVPNPQIEIDEIPCISKLIKQVINTRDGILVLDSDFAECSIVNA